MEKRLPTELTSALAASPEAQRVFLGLSARHQDEYAQHVAEAPLPAARRRRAARMIQLILSKNED